MNEHDELPKVLGDLVSMNSGRLTQADARLLDVLLSDPIRAAMENGKEVSTRAGVHPASAVRLARRLGFSGYPEFRSFLQSNIVDGADGDFESPAARIAARLARAKEGSVLSSILDSEIAALQQVRGAVSDDDIRDFSQALRKARQTFVLGRSHAATLSALVALRLQRSGYRATDLAVHSYQAAEALHTIGADDVVWLFAFRKPATLIEDVARIARKRGARILLISDVNGSLIEPAPDLHITVSRGGVGQSQSLVVPMTIANAIILDLAAIDGGHSLRSLDDFKAFRAALPQRLGR
jgi:DNA-binding MurR/RpiR family transcriptional regulator